MRKRYAIGIDFGILSGNVVLVDISNGEEVSSVIFEYTYKDMKKKLPDGTKLGDDWTLGNPSNYLDVMKVAIPAILKDANIYPSQVIALGIDFACYTVIAIDSETQEIDETNDCFVEATDWIIMQLTGEEIVSSLIYPLGQKVGGLTEEMSMATGLLPGTTVAVPSVSAHVSVPALGVTEPEKMVMIMEKSIYYMILDKEKVQVPGLCGYVEDRIVPGYYGYQVKKSSLEDVFTWFVENFVSEEYYNRAKAKKVNIHHYLFEKAIGLRPGESGLLALDWWNDNKSFLDDEDLTGLMVGVTLGTKPEEIYRALLEAIAFGTRKIIESFNEYGISVKKIYACGEIAEKNPTLMQIISDVCNMEIVISESSKTSALGSAMFAAVAIGKKLGGYDTIIEASKKMTRLKETLYRPIPDNIEIYNELFIEYKKLYDYFGKQENNVMKKLKMIKTK